MNASDLNRVDLGRTFTRLTRISLVTRVWRRVLGVLVSAFNTRKRSRKPPERFFFLRESRVARNSGDSDNPF